jgi:hypothetical protein
MCRSWGCVIICSKRAGSCYYAMRRRQWPARNIMVRSRRDRGSDMAGGECGGSVERGISLLEERGERLEHV